MNECRTTVLNDIYLSVVFEVLTPLIFTGLSRITPFFLPLTCNNKSDIHTRIKFSTEDTVLQGIASKTEKCQCASSGTYVSTRREGNIRSYIILTTYLKLYPRAADNKITKKINNSFRKKNNFSHSRIRYVFKIQVQVNSKQAFHVINIFQA